jgi:hypothetical protein
MTAQTTNEITLLESNGGSLAGAAPQSQAMH